MGQIKREACSASIHLQRCLQAWQLFITASLLCSVPLHRQATLIVRDTITTVFSGIKEITQPVSDCISFRLHPQIIPLRRWSEYANCHFSCTEQANLLSWSSMHLYCSWFRSSPWRCLQFLYTGMLSKRQTRRKNSSYLLRDVPTRVVLRRTVRTLDLISIAT